MLLNNTSIRTSESFGINALRIDEFQLPADVKNADYHISNPNKGITTEYDLLCGKAEKYSVSEEISAQAIKSKALKIHISGNNPLPVIIKISGERVASRIEILSEENSLASLIIIVQGGGYHNTMINASVKSRGKLFIAAADMTSGTSFLSVSSRLSEEARGDFVFENFSKGISAVCIHSVLEGYKSRLGLYGGYIIKGKDICDINIICDVYGKEAECDIDFQGAIFENAEKRFRGTIDFKRGCTGAKGNENEFCVMLSDKAVSKSLPVLLCAEEFVEGNHSTASGKISPQTLFYIMSRGISREEAMKLIVRANLTKSVERIQDEEIRNMLFDYADRLIDTKNDRSEVKCITKQT